MAKEIKYKGKKMKKDYTYCETLKCIHRRGCRRWIGNFTQEERASFKGNIPYLVSDKECIGSIPYPYEFLDRFRNSDGNG